MKPKTFPRLFSEEAFRTNSRKTSIFPLQFARFNFPRSKRMTSYHIYILSGSRIISVYLSNKLIIITRHRFYTFQRSGTQRMISEVLNKSWLIAVSVEIILSETVVSIPSYRSEIMLGATCSKIIVLYLSVEFLVISINQHFTRRYHLKEIQSGNIIPLSSFPYTLIARPIGLVQKMNCSHVSTEFPKTGLLYYVDNIHR